MPGMDDVEGSQELDDKYSTHIFKDTVGQLHICESTGLHTQSLEVWLAQHTDLYPQIGHPHALALKAVQWETSKGGWWISWEDRVWLAHILSHSKDVATPPWKVLGHLREFWRTHVPKFGVPLTHMLV
eukprot:2972778-Prorocentrum_lima.AAC.1